MKTKLDDLKKNNNIALNTKELWRIPFAWRVPQRPQRAGQAPCCTVVASSSFEKPFRSSRGIKYCKSWTTCLSVDEASRSSRTRIHKNTLFSFFLSGEMHLYPRSASRSFRLGVSFASRSRNALTGCASLGI